MLDSFPQSTCSLLPADGLYWTQRRWYEPVSHYNTAEKGGAITANEECAIFPTFPWVVKQKHKESKQITHDHSKNSTKIPKHRTRYILVVTKNISVTACHTSSFKLKIYHLLRTPARWQQIYHGAVNNLLIWAVKCRNTRSLKIYCSFRNHKFCWLFLTYHWVIGLLQLFHSLPPPAVKQFHFACLFREWQSATRGITHGYNYKETQTLSGSLTEKNYQWQI